MAKSKRQKDLEREQREKEKTDHWLIIQRPWFRDFYKRKASLTPFDLGDVLWWLCLLLRCHASKINSLQHQTNRSFIIAKIDLGVDVQSRLGEYKWNEFLIRPLDTEKDMTSQIFEYNYLDYGDPSENQWKEDFPEVPRRPPSQYFVRNFPDPVWCERPRSIDPLGWCVPLPRAANDGQSTTSGDAEIPVRLLSRPPVYSSVNNINMTTNMADPSSTFRPYQSALSQMLSNATVSSQNVTDEKQELSKKQRQLIMITNPYGVRWAGTSRPELSGIWNWLQLIVDGPEEVYADVNYQRVIVQIGDHVSLTGVLGMHVWRNFLKDCPKEFIDETSVVVRAEEDETEGLLKIDIPQVDEEYEAFVSDYPYPEPFLSKTEESKDVKLKLETKDQVKKMEDGDTFLGKRELHDYDEEDDKKRVKIE